MQGIRRGNGTKMAIGDFQNIQKFKYAINLHINGKENPIELLMYVAPISPLQTASLITISVILLSLISRSAAFYRAGQLFRGGNYQSTSSIQFRAMAEDTSSPPKVWLMKSEPDEYSLDDLVRDNVGVWDGIRNYQARNFLRSMTPGDKAYFYYSNCKEPGIYGVMRIHGSAVGDVKALDKKSKYYDPRAKSPETNPWSSVTVTLERRFAVPLLLPQIKALPALSNCRLVAKGEL